MDDLADQCCGDFKVKIFFSEVGPKSAWLLKCISDDLVIKSCAGCLKWKPICLRSVEKGQSFKDVDIFLNISCKGGKGSKGLDGDPGENGPQVTFLGGPQFAHP